MSWFVQAILLGHGHWRIWSKLCNAGEPHLSASTQCCKSTLTTTRPGCLECHCTAVLASWQRCLISLCCQYVSILHAQVVADQSRTTTVGPFGGFVHIRGLCTPAKFSCWLLLAIRYLFAPDAVTAFTGHLCGVIAGLLHVYIPKAGE